MGSLVLSVSGFSISDFSARCSAHQPSKGAGTLSHDADGTGAAVRLATLDAVAAVRPPLSASAFTVV